MVKSWIVSAFLAVVCVGAGAGGRQTAMWGGQQVQMDITKAGATLEFDCATGAITGAVPEKGTFTLKGTFTPGHSGPSRAGDTPDAAATYSGAITGDRMTLTVDVEGRGKDEEALRYQLDRGRPGNVRKCR